tara:strand:+ start:229 stop:396 length:168 start_codon:yes stop_codon:yes gene_type:complete
MKGLSFKIAFDLFSNYTEELKAPFFTPRTKEFLDKFLIYLNNVKNTFHQIKSHKD